MSALILVCAVALQAQPRPGRIGEQREFGLENEVKHPVTLTDAELAALAGDELMKQELGREPPITKVTREGLEASVVHLRGAAERDLVVIGSSPPLIGANVGPFWVIRDLRTGPQVVFSTIALGISIQKTSFKGLRNIESFAATAVEGTTVDFRFNGTKYVEYKEKSGPLGQ